MSFNFVLVCLSIFCVTLTASEKLQFPVCKRSDPNFGKCLLSSIKLATSKLKEGIPELGVPSMDPLIIPSATIGSEGKSAVNVVQKFKNIKIHNLSEIKYNKFEYKWINDKTGMSIDSEISIPEVVFEADYEMTGRMLLLPVEGSGICVIKIINPKIKEHHEFDTVEKNGKKYLNSKSLTMSLAPEKVSFQFNNLFNGNEQLGQELNKVLNENWKDVFDDIKHNHEQLLSQVISAYTNNILSKHEADILIPE